MSILELIDNALDADGDAMRWTPDPVPVPTAHEIRRDMFWLKVWSAVDCGARRRAWGSFRWRRRRGQWRLVRLVLGCGNSDCLCCGTSAWLATVYGAYDETRAVIG